MRLLFRSTILILSIILLAGLVSISCNNDEKTPAPSATPEPTEVENVTITIGHITDMTGVSAAPMANMRKALADVVQYYNDENLISGVTLEVVEYDNQYDPAKDVPGYKSLKAKGADLIWAPLPPSVASLKKTVDTDKFVVFTAPGTIDDLMPPGYVFSLGIMPQYEAYTLLKWIAENDPDFPKDRPARIGGAAWAEDYSDIFLKSMKEYAEAHPEQYDYVGGYLTNFTFIWTTQVEELKDCDYIYIPTPPQTFVRQYRDAGGSAKFIASDVNAAFFGVIDTMELWDEIDGAYFIRSSRWYNETGELIDMTNELLERYRPEEADAIRRSGCVYIGAKHMYLMCDIVKKAVEAVGPENFNSQALYDAAESWNFTYEGISDFNNFTEDKRYASNYYAVYEARAGETIEDSNIFRAHEDWLPQVMEP